MKLTNESNKLMSFFEKNDCLLPIHQTKKTDAIIKRIYNQIISGVSYIQNIKSKMGKSFYNVKIDHITNANQIPKPTTFPPNAFPPEVQKHINKHSIGLLVYTFNMFGRDISILFLTEDMRVEKLIEIYNNYVDYMLVWLYIVNIYSSKKCVKQLKIFVYHTALLKSLPISNVEILNENNVNTAFTRTCPSDSEIVVFRKEEWFKVFMHETFHNFGLDFSGMDLNVYNEKILKIFPVNSDVNLYEAYTEFWARIMNALFCGFINMKDKNDIDEFLTNAEMFINFERIFSFFQMVKILNFMGLSYDDLYKNNDMSEKLRKTLYKEDTNVLSYYVITSILINNYQDFLSWCNVNNSTLLQFKNTFKNLDNLCQFIGMKYKTKSMLDSVMCTKEMLYNIVKKSSQNKNKNKNKDLMYLIQNLRMTICELG